jgi:hypothetical protein
MENPMERPDKLAGQLEAIALEGALSKAQTLLTDVISEFHKL